MSRKKNSSRKSSHGDSRASRVAFIQSVPSVEELQARWKSLRLQDRTKKHLEALLQVPEGGVETAFLATVALELEWRREERMLRVLGDWASEELRLLVLEGACQRIMESGHILLSWFTDLHMILMILIVSGGILLCYVGGGIWWGWRTRRSH